MRVAITGAASGIGAASAAILRDSGAEIVAFDIAKSSGGHDQWIQFDQSDAGSIMDAVAQVDGKFDALLNIAGVPPREGNAFNVLAINYFGLVGFTEAMLDRLSPDASIVILELAYEIKSILKSPATELCAGSCKVIGLSVPEP